MLQMSTFNSLRTLRVVKVLPQPQVTAVSTYFGWMPSFMSQVLAGEYLLRSVSIAFGETAIVSFGAKHHKPQQFSEKRRAEARLMSFSWLPATAGLDFVALVQIGSQVQFAIGFLSDKRRRCRGFSRLLIPEISEYFEDFTTGWEHPAAGSLVGVHGLHEFDLLIRVITLASRGVDLSATWRLASWALSALFCDRNDCLSASFRFATIRWFAAVKGYF
jgi:hypothetical protein